MAASRLRTPSAVLVGALVLGAGVFVVDTFVFAPIISPVFEAVRPESVTLMSDLILGAVLALGFLAGTELIPGGGHAHGRKGNHPTAPRFGKVSNRFVD